MKLARIVKIHVILITDAFDKHLRIKINGKNFEYFESASITNIIRITQITFEFVNNALLIY